MALVGAKQEVATGVSSPYGIVVDRSGKMPWPEAINIL